MPRSLTTSHALEQGEFAVIKFPKSALQLGDKAGISTDSATLLLDIYPGLLTALFPLFRKAMPQRYQETGEIREIESSSIPILESLWPRRASTFPKF